jgi:hypothetical protein
MVVELIPRCGECDDGWRFEPPLQDGARGTSVPCEECKRLAQEYWRNNYRG